MKELIIGRNEAGQRLDKYLKKRLPCAGSGFLHKMLRKKNILLNDRKADGSEKLTEGDLVRLYFSDETYEKFADSTAIPLSDYRNLPGDKLDILYEDEDILIINKPSGMLSQKAAPRDVSANEYLIAYLLASGQLTEERSVAFRPSVCNRLDRNTSGILTAGKSLKGLQALSAMLKERSVLKFYRCFVVGRIERASRISGWLVKDESTNQVRVLDREVPQAKYIETEYTPILCSNDVTLLEVHLITGRSHQIRAHLSSIGHPVVGDMKYGDSAVNEFYRRKYRIQSQLLHAYRMEFPDGRRFVAPMPQEFEQILQSMEEKDE